MAIGLPFVVSNFRMYDFVDSQSLGCLVNPDSPIEIADSLELLLTNNKLATDIGNNGIRVAEKEYSWDSQQKILSNLYSSILKN